MLLVDGLSCDPEGLGHLRPGPARAHRPLDLGILEPISDRAQRGRSREAVSRSADWRRGRGHVSNSSCLEAACQPQLLKPPTPGWVKKRFGRHLGTFGANSALRVIE